MSYSPQETTSGRTVVERRDPLLGTIIGGRFRIDAKLAAGGFGAIYRATHLSSSREVAIKVLHPSLASDPSLVQRFRREGATLTSLTSAHTVTTYEVGEDPDGTLFIVMELLRGETLHRRFVTGGRLAWRRVVSIVRAVCDSLIEAHELGIVHRDLKPANIHLETVNGAEYVKVLDFGIAKIQRGSGIDDGAELTAHGQVIGTFDYMSPEQIVGGALTGRSDIYTLGVVMYEMITGRRPFGNATGPGLLSFVLTQDPEAPSVHAPGCCPSEIDRVVLRCLEREPQDRFLNVVELAAALDRVVALAEGATLRLDSGAHEELTTISHRAARGSSPPVRIAPEGMVHPSAYPQGAVPQPMPAADSKPIMYPRTLPGAAYPPLPRRNTPSQPIQLAALMQAASRNTPTPQPMHRNTPTPQPQVAYRPTPPQPAGPAYPQPTPPQPMYAVPHAGAYQVQPPYPRLDGWASPHDANGMATPRPGSSRAMTPSFDMGSNMAREQVVRRVTWALILVFGLILVAVIASILH